MKVIEELVNRNDWIRILKIKGFYVVEIYNPIGDLIDMGVVCDPQLKLQLSDFFKIKGGDIVEFNKYSIINYYTFVEKIFSPEPSQEPLECNREIADFEMIPIGWHETLFLPKEKLITCLINREADYIIYRLASKFKSYMFEQVAGVWVNYYYYKSDNYSDNYFFLLKVWENCTHTTELFIYQL